MTKVDQFCVLCLQKKDKLIAFTEPTLQKCKEILLIRQANSLKMKDVHIPDGVNNFQQYHRKCYCRFTALPPKYRPTPQKNMNTKEGQPTSTVQPAAQFSFDSQEQVVYKPILQTSSNLQEVESSSQEQCQAEETVEDQKLDTSYVCLFCNKNRKKYMGAEQSLQTCTSAETITDLVQRARELNDTNMIEKLTEIQANQGYYMYHKSCYRSYCYKFEAMERSTEDKSQWHVLREYHKLAFDTVREYVLNNIITNKECCLLSSLVHLYESSIHEQDPAGSGVRIRPYRLKEKLFENFPDSIKIETLKEEEVVLASRAVLLNVDIQKLEADEILDRAAKIVQSMVHDMEVKKLPDNIQPKDFVDGECEVPPKLLDFLEKTMKPKNCRRKISSRTRICKSLAQDWIFAISNGRIKSSKHINLALYLKSKTNSKQSVNVVNKYGHCISDTVLEGLVTEATFTSVQKSTVCPEDILQTSSLGAGVAFNNFDRFVNTQTGKDTLHDTVGIIYQDIPSSDIIHEYENEEEGLTSAVAGPSKRRRRTFGAITFELEPCTKKPRLEVLLEPLDSNLHTAPPDTELDSFKHTSFSWVLSHLLKIPKTPMWVGYNSSIFDDKTTQQKVSYLGTINDSPTRTEVVKETMYRSERIRQELNQLYIEVTYDLAVAKLAYQIQSDDPEEKFAKLFIHLGAFHIYLAYFKAVGKFIENCGISNVLVNSEAIASGSVSGFISSKNYNRCKKLHPRFALALQILHFERFFEDENIVLTDELEESLVHFNSTVAVRPCIERRNLLKLFDKYNEYTKKTLDGQHGKTAQFYIIYVQLINYYLILDLSIRTAAFELYMWVLPRVANLFFAFNQQNYSRFTVLYHNKLLAVEQTHPGLLPRLQQGSFGVKRTEKPCSRIPIDLTMEQTSNADAANTLTGISFITNSYPARQRWASSHSLRCTGINFVLNETGLKKSQDITADLKPSYIQKHVQSLDHIIANIKQNINPFATDLDKGLLFNISTGRATEDRVAQFLVNIEQLGNSQREKFIQECAIDKKRFERPIKQNKIMNFTSVVPKKKLAVAGKLVEVRMERDLFGQLLRVSLEKKLDIDKILSHPLTPVSLAFCHMDGSLCKTEKSVMLKIFDKEVENDEPPFYDTMIFDGFFLLNTMRDVPNTFGSISKKFFQILLANRAKTVIVVFDSYPTPSIKDSEHEKRGTSRGQHFEIRGPDQVRPAEFGKELKNIHFKEALISFFSAHWKCDEMAPYLGNRTLYLSGDCCWSYKVVNDKISKNIIHSLSCPNHEEADTKIVFHVCQLEENTHVIVRCSDTDIPVIMLGNLKKIRNNVKMWMKMGTGNKQRSICINDLYVALGENICLAIIAFYIFTGCDYNPAFFKKGKAKPFIMLKKNSDFIAVFIAICDLLTENIANAMPAIEKFVCTMYGFKKINKVNDARVATFMKIYQLGKDDDGFKWPDKNFDASLLPPSHSELKQHLLRTIYITNIWNNANKQVPSALDPLDYGWQLEEGSYKCKWFDGDQLPATVEMISQVADNSKDVNEQIDDDLLPIQHEIEDSDDGEEEDDDEE